MVENLRSQLSLLFTALLLTTTSISVVSGQPAGGWLISDSDYESIIIMFCTVRSIPLAQWSDNPR
jgi:hypothetical protein